MPRTPSLNTTLLLVPCLAMMSSCAFYRELASPWKTYRAIPNKKNISFDTIVARLKPFEEKYGLKIKGKSSDAIEYEHVSYFSGGIGGTPTKCRMFVYSYNDSIRVFANPCRMYPTSKTGWTDTMRIQNSGDQQAILDNVYYRYIDPLNDSAKEVLDRSNSDDILADDGKIDLFVKKMKFLGQ